MQLMQRPTPLPRWPAFLSVALILPFVALATPCAKQWDTCYDCDPVEGLCLPTPLAAANSQAAQPCACDESGRADRPDETLAPLFDLELSQGMATPNAMVRHTPIHRHAARGPDLALRLYHGYRYEVGNNGFMRHMGKWSHNYELFLEKQDPQIWKLRDASGTGSTWIGPYWANILGIGAAVMEIRSTDYSWRYTLEVCAESNAYGHLIRLRQRHDGVADTTAPGTQSCDSRGCGNAGATRPNAPARATSGRAGFLFEPVDCDADGEADYCRLLQVIGQDGHALTLHYANPTNSLLTSIVAGDGHTWLFAYDQLGLLTNVLDLASGLSATFAYTNHAATAYLNEVTDMGGQVNRFTYATDPTNTNLLRLASLQRPNLTGFDTTTISYNGATNITAHLPDGHSYSLSRSPDGATVYDSRSGLGSWTRQYVEGRAYSWHAKLTDGTQTNLVSPTGQSRTFDWWDSETRTNPTDQRIKDETLPDGTRRHYAWYPNGHLASLSLYDSAGHIINLLTNSTTFFEGTWRPSQKLAERRDATGQTLSRTQQEWSRVPGPATNQLDDFYLLTATRTWSAADAWMETRYIFNTNGPLPLLTEVRELASGTNDFTVTQRYGHDPLDRLAWSWQAGGSTNYYTWDPYNRLASIIQTNQTQILTTSQFNSPLPLGEGQGEGMTSLVTSYTYDPLGRLIRTDYPDATSESWTPAPCGCGWLTHTDRGGNISSNYFNANKWIWKTTTHSPQGTLLAYEERTFDNAGQVTSRRDALDHTSYTHYDAAGRVTNRVDALGRATDYRYDPAGRPWLTRQPDGTISSNLYDHASRLVAVVRLDATGQELDRTTYTHDPLGRTLTTTDALGHVTVHGYDLAGRVIRTDHPDGSYTRTVYDPQGRVACQIGPIATPAEAPSATTTNQYDHLGRLLSTTDPAGRATTYLYDPDWPSQTAATILPDGTTNHWHTYHPLTGRLTATFSDGLLTAYAHDPLGQVTNTVFADATCAISRHDGTRLVQTISRSGLSTTHGYDAAGRRTALTDSHGHTTRFQLDPLGQVTNTIDALDFATATAYDTMNRPVETILPDARASTNTWDALGRLTARTGAGAVPVAYRYDLLGRMTNLIDGVTNVTAFAYDPLGRLHTKTYADASTYTYAYNPRGWLTNRTDALGRTTAYSYDPAGQLTALDYATDPAVTHTYDLLGRLTARNDAAGTWTWSYDGNTSRLLSETLVSTLNSQPSTLSVTYTYHPDTYDLASVSCGDSITHYAWAAGRLTNVTWQAGTASGSVHYEYMADSDLLWKTVHGSGEVVTTRLYDDLDRLTNITTVANGVAVNSFSYTLDATGRRTQRYDADGAQLDWDYDPFDQLTSAARTNSPNGAADAAYRYQYQYDLVGNRLREKRGPDGDPLSRQLILDGSHNNLNQLTARDWSGKLPLHGAVADPDTILLVQGVTNAPPYWNGTNWLAGATLGAGSNSVDIITWLGAESNRTDLTLFMPPAKPQPFQYDLNGNLTDDGYRAYTWDEENRLTAIETTPAAIATGLEPRRSEYLYDAQWRRIQSTDLSAWNGSAYATTNTTRFVWDGWNLLAEVLGPASGVLSTNYYVWGLDLSHTLQGAGGIGGLLAVTSPLTLEGGQGEGGFAIPCYDGNGNITDYLDESGTIIAHRDYDPFGRTVSATGPRQADFSFWFSTKPEDPWWGLYYYGYRYYSPECGRWLSRDPIETFESLNAEDAERTEAQQFMRLLQNSLDQLRRVEKAGRITDGRLSRDLETFARHLEQELRRQDMPPEQLAHELNLYLLVYNQPINLVDPYGLSAISIGLPVAGGCAILDGPLPIGDIVAIGIIGCCVIVDLAQPHGCYPCTPSVGTPGYNGPHTDHKHGPFPKGTPHYHVRIMGQSPWPMCVCHWSKKAIPYTVGTPPLGVGTIPPPPYGGGSY